MKRIITTIIAAVLMISFIACILPLKTRADGIDLPVIPLTPTLKNGDVNGDGSVDNKDVVALFRYLSGDKNVKVQQKTIDVNGDGSVNNKDVTTLFRKVSQY